MRKEAHNSRNSNSKPNEYIKDILDEKSIKFDREFNLGDYVYDFKIGNVLLEINPYATHNINWNPYGGKIISKEYHLLKTQYATSLGYRVINIWDWDDINLHWTDNTILIKTCLLSFIYIISFIL